MIQRYRIGHPIYTDAVVKEIEIREGFPADWTMVGNRFMMALSDKDMVYGLGETVRGINKRGWEYISFCSDDPNHLEDVRSLYGSHNFFIIDRGEVSVGYFFDIPGRIRFDIGYSEYDRLTVEPDTPDLDIYEICADSNRAIVREFRELIGRSYIPPKWAFGYGQSRWSYMDESQVMAVVDNHEKYGIPIDSVYLDIDYMEDYKNFTVSEERFPDFAGFIKDISARGIHLVPIIDAGVKVEEGYFMYEEGIENGYFVKKDDGKELTAAAWPGRVHFPDFLNDEAREWFGNKYKILTDMGIDGFWNDMNEPAIFYTEDHLKEVFDAIGDYKDQNLNVHSFFEFKNLVGEIDNNIEDYERFYHDYKGERVRHDKVHNLYGYYMTRSASEALDRLYPDKRMLLFSRSSYIGMHRYGGIWTGDNKSWWSHLLLNLSQLPALNMCGFMYIGADTGGFGADCTRDLMLRWLGLSIFTPLFRNHSADGTRRQELYEFGDTQDIAKLIRIRYALIPYIYSEYVKAVLNNDMYFAPLSFDYEDDRVGQIEDQLLVGESIMIAPVCRQNASGRMVYLPEDMKLIRFRSDTDYDEEILKQGDHYIKVGLNEVPVFLRPGRVLPLVKAARNTAELDYDDMSYITYRSCPEDYDLYNDDGISRI